MSEAKPAGGAQLIGSLFCAKNRTKVDFRRQLLYKSLPNDQDREKFSKCKDRRLYIESVEAEREEDYRNSYHGNQIIKSFMSKPHKNPDLSKLSEDELMILLGTELTRDERHALAPDTTYLIERARGWVAAQTKALQETICNNARLRAAYEDGDTGLLVSAISDLIAGMCSGVTPITAAYLLVRRGIHNLCKTHWKK